MPSFAIVTAIYAIRAFLKQSKEVSDQAEMLRIQSEQRKLNAEQIRVLALQAAELRESLEERKREPVERRNAQASQVHLALRVVAKRRDGGPEIEATVVNASERQQPIYDVKLYWHLGPDSYGTPNPELLGTVLNWEKEPRRREFPRGAEVAGCGAVLAFRDALGVNWVKTPEGSVMHADSDLMPDIAKALARPGAPPMSLAQTGPS